MVKGRLKRESNPLPGEKAGFTPQIDTTGDGDFEDISPINPMNTKDDLVLAKLIEMDAKLQANTDKIDSVIEDGHIKSYAQLTGSNVKDVSNRKEEVVINKGVYNSRTHKSIKAPRGARGLLVTVYVQSSTGTFEKGEGFSLSVINQIGGSATRDDFVLETRKSQSSYKPYRVMIYPGINKGDMQEGDTVISGLFSPTNYRIYFEINGDFAEGEGFSVSDCVATWLY